MVVVWRTQGGTTPVLRYGNTPEALTNVISGDSITLRVSEDVNQPERIPRLYKAPADGDSEASTARDTFQFEASITGLLPDTKYYYAVFDGEQRLAGGDAEHFFMTHPPVGSATDMRIWVLGDSGKGTLDQVMVFDAMRDYTALTARPVNHFLHVGDMAYDDGRDWEFQSYFFEPYQALLRNTVCWPALGNHEGVNSRGMSGTGPYFDAYVVPTAGEAGGAASGTEAYYSFDISEVHFICLDSHDLDRDPEGAMAQWLRADLEQTKAKWLIAFWHHPPYSKGTHDSDREPREIEMRQNFMPILESAGVDVTLTGHSHIYERSMLMDGAYATPTVAEGVILDDGDGSPIGDGAYRKSEGLHPNEGSISIVAGHGGTTNGRMGTMPVMREVCVDHGSVVLDVTGDTLTGVMIDKTGATRDLFSLVKQGKVTPERIEHPWQPLHDISQITRHSIDFSSDTLGAAPEYWRAASGSSEGMTIVPGEGDRQHLRAKAADAPLVGVFGARRMDYFQYETFIRFSGAESASAGIVFGYIDNDNYWKIVLDAKAGSIQISQVAGGEERVVKTENAVLALDKWLKLGISVSGDSFKVASDGGPDLTIAMGKDAPNGFVGFIVPEGNTAEFLSFKTRHHI